jgi:hypothetical protein
MPCQFQKLARNRRIACSFGRSNESSKLAGPGSPRLGRFDSFAASSLDRVRSLGRWLLVPIGFLYAWSFVGVVIA